MAIEGTKNSTFYLCSSGVFNLIGGPGFKKMMTGDLGAFLREQRKNTLVDQKFHMGKFFNEWTGSGGQNDDIMVIGFKP